MKLMLFMLANVTSIEIIYLRQDRRNKSLRAKFADFLSVSTGGRKLFSFRVLLTRSGYVTEKKNEASEHGSDSGCRGQQKTTLLQDRLKGRRLAAPKLVTATVRLGDVTIEHQPPNLQADLTGLARHGDDVSRHFRSLLHD
jgi:hypothetical protein